MKGAAPMTAVRGSSDPLAARHPTMADAATERLHDAIVTGLFPPGTPLRLIDIAERLGMSSMPVREALRRLEAIGLVTVLPHRGAFVSPLSRDDFEDTVSTRRLLECACIERAANRVTVEDLATCRRHLDAYVSLSEAGRLVEARTAHRDFHYAIYALAGSRWLLHAIDTVWRNSERYRFAAGADYASRDTQAEHEAILGALARRDPEAARRALADHLDGAAARMRANLEQHDQIAAPSTDRPGAEDLPG
jgi:DNA-binding GntR family transcriptional regulator